MSDAASPRSPASSRRISLHRWTMVEDPRRPLLKTTAPLRELPTPIASNRPPASLTCGTRQWHHLFQGQQLTGGCSSMVFQAGCPVLSLSYPANILLCKLRSIPSGRWRTGSKSSSLVNRNSSWVMATRDPVFGGKSTKGTRRLVWSALSASGLRYGLGMRVIPRSWKFVLLVSQDDSQHGGVHRSARCLPASICR